MPSSNRAPDWRLWVHVPTVTLHEGVALSLNLDPKRLRRGTARAILAGKRYDEGPELDRRLELAKRCLGDSLPGPENWAAVRYYDEEPTVRLRNFATWTRSIGWSLPSELEQLGADSDLAVEAADPHPSERLTLPEQVRLLARAMPEAQARVRIEKAFRFKEISYQPEFYFSYEDAQINWENGWVLLSRGPRRPFTPTLSASQFRKHFLKSARIDELAPGPLPSATRSSFGTAEQNQVDSYDANSGGVGTKSAPVKSTADAHTAATLPSGIRMTSAEKAEAACGEWITRLTERPRSKEVAFEKAKASLETIGQLSRKGFDRAWASRAPLGWKKAGRPKRG